jgi:hypothetical protein
LSKEKDPDNLLVASLVTKQKGDSFRVLKSTPDGVISVGTKFIGIHIPENGEILISLKGGGEVRYQISELKELKLFAKEDYEQRVGFSKSSQETA